MIRAKYAKLIRVGIFSKCLPYEGNIEPDPVFGGYFTHLDINRLHQIQRDWISYSHIPLVQRARERTKPWTSVRYV